MAARRSVGRDLGAAVNRRSCHRHNLDSQLFHTAHRDALDLLLHHRHRRRGPWRRSYLLRQAPVVSAAPLLYVRTSSPARATSPLLPLGLHLCLAWSPASRMFTVVKTLKWPNEARQPTPVEPLCCIRTRLARRGCASRWGCVQNGSLYR